MTLVLTTVLLVALPGDPLPSPVSQALSAVDVSSGAVWLAQMKAVQKELKLSAEQLDEVTRCAEELRAELRRGAGRFFGADGDEHGARRALEKKRIHALTMKTNQRVLALLSVEQAQRIDQLYLRFLEGRALVRPQVATRLRLSKPQQESLNEALRNNPHSMTPLLNVLTPQQRAQFTRLLGDPFVFPRPQIQTRQDRGSAHQAPNRAT